MEKADPGGSAFLLPHFSAGRRLIVPGGFRRDRYL